jgi:HEAT repeat protein
LHPVHSLFSSPSKATARAGCLILLAVWPAIADSRAAQGDAETALRRAETAYDKRQYEQVLALTETLTRRSGETEQILRLRTRALTRMGRAGEALHEYGQLEVTLGADDEPLLRDIALAFITTVLKDMREQMRGAGYTALKELESEDTVSYFEDGLSDGSGLVRALAAEGMGRLKTGRRSPALRRALEDQAAMVRAAALKALGRSGDPAVTQLLEKYLTDEQPTVRIAAAGALARLGRTDGWSRIREATKAANPDERGAAFRALGELQDRSAAAMLTQGVKDPQPSVRGAAAMALADLRTVDAAGAIEPLLSDPIPAVRAAAAISLGEAQARTAVSSLKRASDDPNPAVSAAAIDALLHLGSDFDTIAVQLRRLTQSTDPGTRAAAAKALGKSRPRAAHEAFNMLKLLLNDPLPRPRIAAARALGRFQGADRRELIRLLKGALTDQDEAVRATVAGSLGRILSMEIRS